jgi:hypothetical protein
MNQKLFLIILIILLSGGVYFYSRRSSVYKPTLPTQPTTTTKEISAGLSLDILQPQEGTTVDNQNLMIKGKTAAEAEVFVNEKQLKADSNGDFFTTITLDEGENNISIVANDEDGNFAEKEITVTYNSGETF